MQIRVMLFMFLLAAASLWPRQASGNPPDNAFPTRLEGSAHYGFVWAHAGSLRHLSRTHFPLFQLAVSRKTSGNREWHGLYKYPEIGLSIMAGEMGYPEVLGTSFALFPHLRLSLIESSRFRLNIRYGLGAAYLTKTFHRTGNYRNTAIGSHLNMAFHSRLEAGVTGAGGRSLLWGLGLTHFSNGAIRKPNKGINIPTISLTYSFPAVHGPAVAPGVYDPAVHNPAAADDPADPPATIDAAPPRPVNGNGPDGAVSKTERITAVLSLAGGASGIYSTESALYPAVSIAATASFAGSPKWRVGLGGDLFFNAADLAMVQLDGSGETHGHQLKGGAHLSYEQVFGKLDFIFQTGVYLVDPYKVNGPLYNRLGFRHTLPGNWVLHFCLKTHTFTASFLEFGMGYRFFNQP